MEAVYIIVFVAVLLLYGYINWYEGNAETVLAVEAGATEGMTADELDRKCFRDVLCSYNVNGHDIDMNKHVRLLVNGNCMRPRGIYDGEEVIAEEVDAANIKGVLKSGDILYIYIDDTKMRKIREFRGFGGDGVVTCYYDEDGSEHFSSKVHSLKSVRGIVRYKL